MSAALQRVRRLLLLLPVAARAARAGRGVPLAKAVELTGAKDEATLREDVASVADLWSDPIGGDDAIDLYVQDGEVHVTYELQFGSPPAFSLAEGAVLLAALRPFEEDGPAPVKALARKLRRAVPDPLRAEADRLSRGLDLPAPPEPWAKPLQEAIDRRLETVLTYRAVADGEAARRTVEPRIVFQRDGRWYLAAFNPAREEEHLFRLDRIVSVEVGTRCFGEHKGPPVARYVRRNLYFESGAEREVTLRFRGTAAKLALARHGARARAGEDGTVSVAAKLTPGPYLFGLVLGHGGEVDVDAPDDVGRDLRAHAARLLEAYSR